MNPPREQIIGVLSNWLMTRLNQASIAWVQDRQKLVRAHDTKSLYLAFGMTPRKVGKADLALTPEEFAAAEMVRPGWNPRGWSVDQAVRSILILSLPDQDSAALVSVLDQIFGTGEVGELVALYQMLPLLPHPTAHVLRAAEGIRTNIKAVFCAVAHQNPFPAEQFSEDQWNQMVLKCHFIGVPMSPIVGLDQRANPRLASMVIDFVHERRAAHRTVAPDMWRCVGRCADERGLNELKSLLATGSPIERQAAALALKQCPQPEAEKILSTASDLTEQLNAGKISWSSIDETN